LAHLLLPRVIGQKRADYSLQRCKGVLFAGISDCYSLKSPHRVIGIGGFYD
jgi:hypothetical protein